MTNGMSLRGISGTALFISVLLLVAPVPCAAAFRVELDTAPPLRPLLERHLLLYRELADPRLTVQRFHYLAGDAIREARDLLATEGFFSPRTDYEIVERGGDWIARLAIAPGEPARVADLKLEFTGAIQEPAQNDAARLEELRASWPMPPGTVFRDEDWARAKDELLARLHADRYPAARFTHTDAAVDPDHHAVELRVTIDSGPACVFGAPEFQGLAAIPERVVSALSPIRSGARYRSRLLEEYRAALQATGYFDSVFVLAPVEEARDGRVPVRVIVVEVTKNRGEAGVGFNTDTGFGVELQYRDREAFRPAWRSESALLLEQRRQKAVYELFLPPLAHEFQPRLAVQLQHEDIQDEESRDLVAIAKLVRATPRSELVFSAAIYDERRELPGQPRNAFNSLPLNVSWTRRKLDDPLYPRAGFLFNVQAGGAIESVLSDEPFLRLYGKASAFWPLGSKGTLQMRGEAGAVETDDRTKVPNDYLFITGGGSSVRGYKYNSLGIDENGAIVHGRYLGVVSAEYTHDLGGNWSAAAFFDAGNVVDDWQDFHFAQGWGAGARWKSPVGPLNMDLAYGEETGDWRLHVSIGFLF